MMTRSAMGAALAALALVASSGPSMAQAPAQQPTDNRSSQGSQMSTPNSGPQRPTPRQAAQAGLGRSQGHKLDNIADKLNACMLHAPQDRQACIDEAVHNP